MERLTTVSHIGLASQANLNPTLSAIRCGLGMELSMEALMTSLMSFFERSWKFGLMLTIFASLSFVLHYFNIPDPGAIKPFLTYTFLAGAVGISILLGHLIGIFIFYIQKKNADGKTNRAALRELEIRDINALDYAKHLDEKHMKGMCLIFKRYGDGLFIVHKGTGAFELIKKSIILVKSSVGYECICYVNPCVLPLKDYIIERGQRHGKYSFDLDHYLTTPSGGW